MWSAAEAPGAPRLCRRAGLQAGEIPWDAASNMLRGYGRVSRDFACQSGKFESGRVSGPTWEWEADTRGQRVWNVGVRRGSRGGPGGDRAGSRGVAPSARPGDVSGPGQVRVSKPSVEYDMTGSDCGSSLPWDHGSAGDWIGETTQAHLREYESPPSRRSTGRGIRCIPESPARERMPAQQHA